MTTDLSTRVTAVAGVMESSRFQTELAKAIPKGVGSYSAVNATRMFLTALRNNSRLAQCTDGSLYSVLFEASQLGLALNGFEAVAMPFENKAARCYEAQFVLGYRGVIKLAHNSGSVSSIQARAVYRGDEYEYSEGREPVLRHVPGAGIDRSDQNIVAFYAIARMTDGTIRQEWMWNEDVLAIGMRVGRGKLRNAWITDYAEMGKKTVIKRAGKTLPQAPALHRATQLDDLHEIGKPQVLDASFVPDANGGTKPSKEAKSALDELAGEFDSSHPEDAELNLACFRHLRSEAKGLFDDDALMHLIREKNADVDVIRQVFQDLQNDRAAFDTPKTADKETVEL